MSVPEELMSEPDYSAYQISKEQVIKALEHAIFVVPPNCTLVVRVPGWLDRRQIASYQHQIDGLLTYHGLRHNVLVLPGEEFAVMRNRPGTGPQPAARPDTRNVPTEAMHRIDGTGPNGLLQ